MLKVIDNSVLDHCRWSSRFGVFRFRENAFYRTPREIAEISNVTHSGPLSVRVILVIRSPVFNWPDRRHVRSSKDNLPSPFNPPRSWLASRTIPAGTIRRIFVVVGSLGDERPNLNHHGRAASMSVDELVLLVPVCAGSQSSRSRL